MFSFSRNEQGNLVHQITDTTKFHQATGWVPEIPFEETLQNLLDYHREKTKDMVIAA